ncbi:MAG: adenosine deaminase [Pseudomonadota bacterium]
MSRTADLIAALPKAELHLHIEGSFEPELMLAIAERNKIKLPWATLEDAKAAYDFDNLQEFLDLYYKGMDVLRTEEDFYDLTYAYLERVDDDNVRHVEIFFDPQAHTERGVPFAMVADGILTALKDGERDFGISSKLIMSFLRHLSEEDGLALLQESAPWHEHFVGVGLDSSEVGHPPSKFARLFKRCDDMGFKLCLHAGEEGPPEYVHEALFEIGADRIDHGNRAMEDPALIEALKDRQTPITSCPLSNLSLCVIDDVRKSPVKAMLDAGLLVTVNSDDPAYFGGYVNENLEAVATASQLSSGDLIQLAKNSFSGSFLTGSEKQAHLEAIDAVAADMLD